MKAVYEDFLFEKHYLIANSSDASDAEKALILAFLAKKYGILITKGEELVSKKILEDILDRIDIDIPVPFYKNFPASVKAATDDEILIDQLIHYATTYGLGRFDAAGHSLFEIEVERKALTENTKPSYFSIVNESEGNSILIDAISDVAASPRPLSVDQYLLVKEAVEDFGAENFILRSKSTAIKLLADTKNIALADYISLADILKVVEAIMYKEHKNVHMNKIHLHNQDRKFITKLLDKKLLDVKHTDIYECSERKKIWAGLLHHIHYVSANNLLGDAFVSAMRDANNYSILSGIEKRIAEGEIESAVYLALKYKGFGFVLRNLTYYLSRCSSVEKAKSVLERIFSADTQINPIVMMQLLASFLEADSTAKRIFTFVKNNNLKSHTETPYEMSKRRSIIADDIRVELVEYLKKTLASYYKNKLGKVYLSPELNNYALPINLSAANAGIGVLPTGTRIPVDDTNVRVFTYWEKVDDIDLSAFLINSDNSIEEFSWRTFSKMDRMGITFSGDQTSGYHGGSEFFDIDFATLSKSCPDGKYIVFCDNVFSRKNFNECFCKAGFMLRKDLEAGNVYEPKTVKTSFLIDCPTTMCYLFAIDISTRELIWLNLRRSSQSSIAAADDISLINKYIAIGKVLNYKWFVDIAATEIVDSPKDADVIISDIDFSTDKSVDDTNIVTPKVIHGYDYEKIISLLN